jgi:DNA helicase II / ATP-dependent DNA helicase PcrA
MMTIHNAKGLEFNSVFVVGMEEGIFPHQLSLEDDEPSELEEERRLCYVAMTRAKRTLYLTAAQRRRLYQSTQYNPVSRFIGEIPRDQLVYLSPVGEVFPKKKRPVFDEFKQDTYDDFPENLPYPPGTRVVHPEFGMGTVRKIEGSPDNLKLTINFQRSGMRKLLLNYCTLERVDG